MNLNKAELIGNLVRDPEEKTTQTGATVIRFSIATNYGWKDKQSGEKKNEVEYHDCVAFGKLADVIKKYVKKGDKLYIDGRLKTSHWEDKSGGKHQQTTIVLQNLIMLGSKPKDGNAPATTDATQPDPPAEPEINVEDIPF